MRNAAGFPERSKDANVNSGSRSSLSLMPLLAGVALPGIAPAQDIEGAASDNPKYGAGLIMMDGFWPVYSDCHRSKPAVVRCAGCEIIVLPRRKPGRTTPTGQRVAGVVVSCAPPAPSALAGNAGKGLHDRGSVE